jgi:hypothetical protein
MRDSEDNVKFTVLEVEIISYQQLNEQLFDESGIQTFGYALDDDGNPVLTKIV